MRLGKSTFNAITNITVDSPKFKTFIRSCRHQGLAIRTHAGLQDP